MGNTPRALEMALEHCYIDVVGDGDLGSHSALLGDQLRYSRGERDGGTVMANKFRDTNMHTMCSLYPRPRN